MKNSRKKLGLAVLTIGIAAVMFGVGVALGIFQPKKTAPKLEHTKITIEGRTANDTKPWIPNSGQISVPATVTLNAPFTSQAPFGNWSDPNEEAGCEEASMLMAWHWIKGDISGTTIPQQQAEDELQAIFKFEQEHYGNSIDTSTDDTQRVWKDYFKNKNIEVTYDITNDDIITALAKGSVVLIPANGQALGNPHFKNPGPVTHMLLIKGYDDAKQQYITNDPGTKFGENYEYAYSTLFNAIRDYPTGDHVPFTEGRKVMLVISK